MENKKISKSGLLQLTAIALAAHAVISAGDVQASPKKGEKTVECFGINTCKGTNGCGVGKNQIDLANQMFHGKFAKAQTMDCSGNSDCSAKSGFLSWLKKDTQSDCLNSGGFVFDKDNKGILKIVKKDG